VLFVPIIVIGLLGVGLTDHRAPPLALAHCGADSRFTALAGM
jgi:hypothetical protein